jgi:hypothetical protein
VLTQAGLNSAVPFTSWPSARNVSVADCMAAPPGDATAADVVGVEAGAEAGVETGLEDTGLADAVAEATGLLAPPEAAELPDELHAVSSKAVAASSVPAATDRPFRLVKVFMVSSSSNVVSGLSEPCQL